MDLETIHMLLKLMEEHDLAELEVEREGEMIRLRKKESQGAPQLVALSPQQVPQPASPPSEPPTNRIADEKVLPDISSPMVGTFYSRPDPESPPYIEVGDAVEPNTIVCIIEAMKVMNEIRAEVRGHIAEALVGDGEPVEFGQALFRVESLP